MSDADEFAVGLTIPQRAAHFGVMDLSEMIDLAVDAEATSSISSVWVGDSLNAKPRADSIVLLGALATATTRVRLGVGCMASFPLRHPFTFAYQWASLDQLSGGRMQLAACTGIVKARGVSEAEGSIYGIPDRERAGRLADNIRVCRQLWAGETLSDSDLAVDENTTSLDPRPVQDPCPIWIASNPRIGSVHFEGALDRVAQLADGWMTVQRGAGQIAQRWRHLQGALSDADRDPATFPRMAYHNINIGSDHAAARSESRRFLEEYYGSAFDDETTEAWTALGSADQCVEHLQQLRADGVTAVTLRLTSWDQRGQLEALMADVLPQLD